MQKLQTHILLVAVFTAVLGLSACKNKADAVPTAADYLHDIDAAKAMLAVYKNNPAKYATDPAVINASQAMATIGSDASGRIVKCWTGSISTATTDHACLDSQGFKR